MNSINTPISLTREPSSRELTTGVRELTHEEAIAEARWLIQQQQYNDALKEAIELNQIKED